MLTDSFSIPSINTPNPPRCLSCHPQGLHSASMATLKADQLPNGASLGIGVQSPLECVLSSDWGFDLFRLQVKRQRHPLCKRTKVTDACLIRSLIESLHEADLLVLFASGPTRLIEEANGHLEWKCL